MTTFFAVLLLLIKAGVVLFALGGLLSVAILLWALVDWLSALWHGERRP